MHLKKQVIQGEILEPVLIIELTTYLPEQTLLGP